MARRRPRVPRAPRISRRTASLAVLASTGDLWGLVPLGLVAAVGATIGDNIAFALGRRLGTTRWGWMRRPRVAAAFATAEQALTQRSAALILGARYIPVGRVAVNMTAGAVGLPWRRFLPLSILAGISWSALSLIIGLAAGSWIKDQPLVSAAIGIAVALVIGLIIDRVAAARRRRAPALHLAG